MFGVKLLKLQLVKLLWASPPCVSPAWKCHTWPNFNVSCICLFMRESVGKHERTPADILPSVCSGTRAGSYSAWSQELNPGLPLEWQKLNYLSSQLLQSLY